MRALLWPHVFAHRRVIASLVIFPLDIKLFSKTRTPQRHSHTTSVSQGHHTVVLWWFCDGREMTNGFHSVFCVFLCFLRTVVIRWLHDRRVIFTKWYPHFTASARCQWDVLNIVWRPCSYHTTAVQILGSQHRVKLVCNLAVIVRPLYDHRTVTLWYYQLLAVYAPMWQPHGAPAVATWSSCGHLTELDLTNRTIVIRSP